MSAKLKISVECAWRGGTLDIVTPIVELPLFDHDSIAGLKNIGKEYKLALDSGDTVMVWCALTPNRQIKFSVSQKKTIFDLTTEGPFYVELYLPDGKCYQFQYEANS
jgi:hypothetical protein